ncbi:hypothetical protein MLD38_022877 [Melastoma candidum]|uniref:Uncharacterized protein n=1 Tax=Melastoma candidum TaxID=119954 RepID=A0ACB9QKR4_9MYRT|nr:hypothetical protein MLD38_022877 [Melastoma candidum]
MEDLFTQFALLSDQALIDKSFDPYAIHDLLKFFEVDAYNAWSSAELSALAELDAAEAEAEEAETVIAKSAMEEAMDEFRRFEEEMDRMAREELGELVENGERAWRIGVLMDKAATAAAKKYMDGAVGYATASMRSAWKSLGAANKKVHPS